MNDPDNSNASQWLDKELATRTDFSPDSDVPSWDDPGLELAFWSFSTWAQGDGAQRRAVLLSLYETLSAISGVRFLCLERRHLMGGGTAPGAPGVPIPTDAEQPGSLQDQETDTTDVLDPKVTERRREAIRQELVRHARERFVLVGEVRRMRGLSHPRMQRVHGRDLRPGWFVSTQSRSYWCEGEYGRYWNVVVAPECNGMVQLQRLDPNDGCLSVDVGGGPEMYLVDTLSMDPVDFPGPEVVT